MAANTKSLDLESGSSQYATISDASQSGLDLGTGPFAIRLWLKREGTGVYMGIVNKWMDSDQDGFRVTFNGDNTLGCACTAGGVFDIATSTGTITDTNWHFISFLRNGTTLRIAVDGTEDGTATDNARQVSNSANFHIGAYRSTPDNYFDGLIDEVAVYNNTQTSAALYAAREDDLTGTTGLVSYWKLNDDYTAIGTANTLTAVNSPVFSAIVPFANYTGVVPNSGFVLHNNPGIV